MPPTKAELRRQKLAERRGLDPATVAALSARIAANLQALPAWRAAGTVMLYVAFRNEVETAGLIQAALAAGKRVAVPVCRPERILIPSVVRDFPGDLSPGTWGILEPRPETLRPLDPRELDLIAVPGVAFDRRGNRLGYGGGYYDNFLPRRRPGALAAALAFRLQVVATTYPDANDQPMDLIVSEDEVIWRQENVAL